MLPSYWAVDVCATDSAGCWGRYNPTTKHDPTAPRMVLDFDWVLPATTANLHKILAEIIRLANAE